MAESLETYARRVGVILFMIEQELSTRKFLNTLRAERISDIRIERNLDNLILQFFEVYDGSDETFQYYTDIMDKHADQINSQHYSVPEQARQVYLQLHINQRRLSETTPTEKS